MAFSSEVGIGSRKENASKQNPGLSPPSAALLVRQPIAQCGRRAFLARRFRFRAGLLYRDGSRRRCRFAGEPQRFQLRHIVEHGFRGGVAVGFAGPRVLGRPCRFVQTRLGAVAILFCHFASAFFGALAFAFGLAFGSGGLARSWASLASRSARNFSVRLRMAMSAAAISAIALMPSTSWVRLRCSRSSFISAGLLGSSFIWYLWNRDACRRALFRRYYHGSDR